MIINDTSLPVRVQLNRLPATSVKVNLVPEAAKASDTNYIKLSDTSLTFVPWDD